MEVAAAAAPRTYPISLVPSPCKAATMRPIFSNRRSKLSATPRTLTSKCDQASAVTIMEPRKNQKFYLSEDEEETETDSSNFIERLELLEEQALRIGNDCGDSEDGGGGREATDYNRRAQIFDKCSKVFQALKHGE